MYLNEYQERAGRTAIYPANAGLVYTALGLASEAGEVAGKVKKIIRDSDGVITDAASLALAHEVADCLWYVAMLADELGYSLNEIAALNLHKLESRAKSGTLKGDGDER